MRFEDAEEEGTCYLASANAYGGTVDLLTVPSVSPSGKRVVGIDYLVFSGEEIKDFVLPDTLEWISYNAFEDTPFFENEQNWEGDCLYIGEYLVDCREPMEGETTLTVKDGTRLIADNTFRGDWKEVVIPESVEHIGQWAFRDCPSLEAITVLPENPTYHTETGCLIETASKTLIAAVNAAEIPNDGSVLHIGAYAFEGRSDLSTALPDCILTIGEWAFYGCSFTVFPAQLPNSLVEVGDYAFWACYYGGWNNVTLQIPATTERIGRQAFTSFLLDGIRVAEGNPVYHSAGDCLIETASGTLLLGGSNSVIPDDGSIRGIGERAFHSYYAEHVVIPEGVTYIGYEAFEYAYMTTLSLPSTLREIGAYAFAWCRNLTELVIPSSVTKIGFDAFTGCHDLYKVTFPEGLEELGGQAFADCDSLVSVHLPRSLKQIGTEEGYENGGYYSETMGKFSGCDSLVSLTVDPQNPVYYSVDNCIIERATGTLVAGCNASIIPSDGSVKRIGENAFDGFQALTVVRIPTGVTAIEEHAFVYCENLQELHIPKTVTEIGYYICYAYEETPLCIYYEGTVAEWQALTADVSIVAFGEIPIYCADGETVAY